MSIIEIHNKIISILNSPESWLFPDTGESLLAELILGPAGLKARPALHTDDVHPGVTHCKSREGRELFIESSFQISELRTLESPESLSRVAAQVGEEVWPGAGVTLLVPGQAQGDRNVRVLSLARHLTGNIQSRGSIYSTFKLA